MTRHIGDALQFNAARIAGFGYLIIIVAGIIAEFVLRSQLIESGNVAATAKNIAESESLFRFSIVLDLIMIGADLIVAVALYVLLRPISQPLALLAAFFRLVMDAILGLNLLNLLAALMLVNGSIDGTAFEPEQLQTIALSLLEIHALGYSIALVPFGLGTIVISFLLFKSGYVPPLLAGLLALAAAVYLSGSTVHLLAPAHEDSFAPAYALPFVAELAFALWLSFKGVKVRLAQEQGVPVATS